MDSIVLSDRQREAFVAARRELPVYDEAGKLLGFLVSPEAYTRMSARTGEVPFTKSEIAEFRTSGGGCSLDEFWKTMGVR
jgi:hypothetical protein